MAEDAKEKSKLMKVLQSVCSLAIVCVVCYSAIYGAELISSAIAVSAVAGLFLPAVVVESSEGLIEVFASVLIAFVEGLVDAATGVLEAIGSIFS